MTEQTVIDIGAKTIWVAMKVASPALFATLIAGLVISVIQAATQINEQTLSFIPKIIVMTVAIIVCGPWIIQTMMGFTTDLFHSIPAVTHSFSH